MGDGAEPLKGLVSLSYLRAVDATGAFVTKVLDAGLTAKDKKRAFNNRMQIRTGVLARIQSGFQS